MGESTKAICALLLIVGSIAAAVAWNADRPDSITWGFRIGGLILATFALGLILKLHFRADIARDYLREIAGTYFNRDGFCFAFAATNVDGIGYMDAYFQSQQDKPSVGRIAMRPAKGFMGRANIETISYEIDCPPAGFGVARIAIPIPDGLQGQTQSFEVGASVSYPNGKGKRLRFFDGIFLRSNTNFGDSFTTTLIVAGAAAGSIVLAKPAVTTVDLPENVAEDIPKNLRPELRTLWRLGEPPLDDA